MRSSSSTVQGGYCDASMLVRFAAFALQRPIGLFLLLIASLSYAQVGSNPHAVALNSTPELVIPGDLGQYAVPVTHRVTFALTTADSPVPNSGRWPKQASHSVTPSNSASRACATPRLAPGIAGPAAKGSRYESSAIGSTAGCEPARRSRIARDAARVLGMSRIVRV